MNKKKQCPGEGVECAASEEQKQEAAAAETNEAAAEKETVLRERDKALQERDEYLALAQRVKADFENYKRRNQNAREDAYTDAVRDTLTKFLPVLDNLERAAAASGSEDALREGVQLVLKQFTTVLCGAGVEEIPAQDCAFDPNLHHAVMQEPVEGCESGKVVTVLQKGYKHGDRVLRHCMVKVSE